MFGLPPQHPIFLGHPFLEHPKSSGFFRPIFLDPPAGIPLLGPLLGPRCLHSLISPPFFWDTPFWNTPKKVGFSDPFFFWTHLLGSPIWNPHQHPIFLGSPILEHPKSSGFFRPPFFGPPLLGPLLGPQCLSSPISPPSFGNTSFWNTPKKVSFSDPLFLTHPFLEHPTLFSHFGTPLWGPLFQPPLFGDPPAGTDLF